MPWASDLLARFSLTSGVHHVPDAVFILRSVMALGVSPLSVKCPAATSCTHYIPTNPGLGHEVGISVVQKKTWGKNALEGVL